MTLAWRARRDGRWLGAPAIGTSILLALAACSSTPRGEKSAGVRSDTPLVETDRPARAPRRAPNLVPVPERRSFAASPDAPDAASPGCGGPLQYMGGPVLQNPKVYAVYWTSAVDPSVVASIGQFYTDVLASPYWDLLGEYTTVGVVPVDSGSSTNQGMSRGTYGGAYTITPITTTCTGASACTLDDTQIQAELAAQIAAGTLPAVTTGCDGQVSSLYMIELPASITTTATIGGVAYTSCVNFCGYHYYTVIGGQTVPYGVIPDLESGPCASICSLAPPATFADVTSVHSHELAEAATDTAVTFTSSDQFIRPSAWASETCSEIGDECSFQEQAVTFGADTWTVQRLWSNALGGCVVSGAPKPVCTAPGTPPGCRACTCADDQFGGPASNGCDGATPYCETSSASVSVGNCVACTTSAECSPSQICAVSSTPSTNDVCVPCGGDGQPCCSGGTCRSPDTCGGGGAVNVCGCTPLSVCPSGDTCGTVADGCGGSVSCGPACVLPATCGGAGVANQCGCTPLSACPAGDACGAVDDGCGGTVSCGACSGGLACVSHSCVAASDSGVPADSGVSEEAGAPADSGKGGDSGAHGKGDSGAPGDATPDGASGAPSGQSGGCSCRTAEPARGPSPAMLWAGVAALASVLQRRRLRRRRASSLDLGAHSGGRSPRLQTSIPMAGQRPSSR